MNVIISPLSEVHARTERDSAVEQARTIFIETSGNPAFASDKDRNLFEERYFGLYLDAPESFYIALRENLVLGYLAGAPETLDRHFHLNPYLERFRTEITEFFPAHLHINLTGAARGSGTGSKLIQRFESDLLRRSSRGLHIVTSSGARNVSFYQQNGFVPVSDTEWNQKTLLMMGKKFPL